MKMVMENRRKPIREMPICCVFFYVLSKKRMYGSEICSEIPKFWTKLSSHEHRLGGVKWCQQTSKYGYEKKTKAQSFQWNQQDGPTPKKAQVVLNVKVLLTVFLQKNVPLLPAHRLLLFLDFLVKNTVIMSSHLFTVLA